MPNNAEATGAPWSAQSGGSHLSTAHGLLALFGPRPSLPLSTPHRETTWQQWDVGEKHHGLARFRVAQDGLIDKEPVQAIPRKKPCQVSTSQWEER